MKDQSERPLHLSPSEVRSVIEDYVQRCYPRTFGKRVSATFDFSEETGEFTGATVEVTQP